MENKFNIGDSVVLLTDMPFAIKNGDKCIVTNISSIMDNSGSVNTTMYHIRKKIDSIYEFRVYETQIKMATKLW